MTKRRTAERAVIDAAIAFSKYRPGAQVAPSWVLAGRVDAAVKALLDLDLEPATAVRTTSLPFATSQNAAAYMSKRVKGVVAEVFREILSVHRQGAIGCTTDALEQRLRRSHQSVSPRVTDLRDQGWIEDSGKTRKTRWGQDAVVWKPTAAALAAAEHVKDWSW